MLGWMAQPFHSIVSSNSSFFQESGVPRTRRSTMENKPKQAKHPRLQHTQAINQVRIEKYVSFFFFFGRVCNVSFVLLLYSFHYQRSLGFTALSSLISNTAFGPDITLPGFGNPSSVMTTYAAMHLLMETGPSFASNLSKFLSELI